MRTHDYKIRNAEVWVEQSDPRNFALGEVIGQRLDGQETVGLGKGRN